MPQMSVTLKGLNEARRAFKLFPDAVGRELQEGIQRSVFTLERTAKSESPVKTGRLRASHRTQVSRLKGELFPTTDYAGFVHEGTRGRSGNPWLQRTATSETIHVTAIMQDAINRAINRSFK